MVTIFYIVIIRTSMHKQSTGTIHLKAIEMGTIGTIWNAFGDTLALPQWPRFYSSPPARGKGGIWEKLRVAHRNRRTRIHLIDLTDDQLRDIGITRHEALREIQKSVFL